ncbi:hypothetical protein OKW45_004183 [Paraburkholderia sp. WSM4175]|uniref:hypothetical protein n=1 Tax=Paraburkholderia sp. WSM4175 TaxID=2991072 RepID=UPI003D19F1BE
MSTAEDLRRYQHLVDHGTSPLSLNAAIARQKSLFEVALDRPERMVSKDAPGAPARTLPVMLSPDEVALCARPRAGPTLRWG